jgi:chorismate dehydratase
MKPVIGSVPYLNAKPLIKAFQHQGNESPVEVVCDVPSHLPPMLDAGHAQAVMASSFDALRTPGRRIAGGVSISSLGAAESVRLFSKVEPRRIEKLALDESSLTSNHLTLVLLAERYGARPQAMPVPPDREAMLAEFDAAVLIGDNGLAADEAGLEVLDLGSEWVALTGLPFVWALWIGRTGLDTSLARHLSDARDWGLENLGLVARDASRETVFSLEVCEHYLRDIMDYSLTERHLEGLRTFGKLLVKNGFLSEANSPKIVGG